MKHKIIQTKNAPAAIGPYSQGIVASPWLFVSGQIGIKPETGEFVGADFESQARQSLENLRQIVLEAGYELTDVVSVDVFLTDIGNFSAFNKIYQECFSAHHPTRAVIGVNTLPKDAVVEIRCVAYRDNE